MKDSNNMTPTDPFADQGQMSYPEQGFEDKPEVENSESAVAITKGRSMTIMAILGVVISIMFYMIFIKTDAPVTPQDTEKKPSDIPTEKLAEAPKETDLPSVTPPLNVVAAIPDAPKLVPPTPPAPPPLPEAPQLPQLPSPTIVSRAADVPPSGQPLALRAIEPERTTTQAAGTQTQQITLEQRRKSGIILTGGGGGATAATAQGTPGSPPAGATTGATGSANITQSIDPFYQIGPTSAQQTKASYLGNPANVVAQGKMIDAILETAINTDVPGSLRAVISRDVYSEAGKNILIPKGSRLIGTYAQSAPVRGQTRVAVSWTRVIRPDGIDLNINSPGTDQLGRSGVEGSVDNRYLELFGNAILLSVVNISIAAIADKISGNEGNATSTTTSTSTTTGQTSTTSTSTATGDAIKDSVTTVGDTARGVVDEFLKVAPTITVDQGTRLKVFVQQDIVFPENFETNSKMIK